MVFPGLASDGLILVIWPCPEARSANFLVIQAHPSRRFYLAVDYAHVLKEVADTLFPAAEANWRFTTADARIKLKSPHPAI